ncbi:hypothetical protein SB00020_03354 [Klebsiella pneumoniae subsp. pneumoniae]|nr:Uncharacterised protein [Klebsiella pneumoniae]VGP26181.1 hypothetical protein SB00020_03354 [Klebsiella pneumoniae subsp. pneumoniae]
MTSRGENSRGSIFNCSDSIFEKSRISLMIFSSRLEELFIAVTRRSTPFGNALVCSRSRLPMMPYSGVRSSWLTVARNIDFDWLACSAAWAISCSDSSIFTRAETSTSTQMATFSLR